ncbi:MAG TPA: N-acetylmuramoyl-L-alanine amidase-like domain-containing protein [Longimicrobiaceae bacterium]|nr:N-acetylmuramoyl-L-alanine amidase-like domain-containing protein [Longimicrobiaceae bacterium]
MYIPISRRDFLLRGAAAALALGLPGPLRALARLPEAGLAGLDPLSGKEDRDRLTRWVAALRAAGLHRRRVPLGNAVARAGELALGTPYEAYTLEAYLKAGGSPWEKEPLTLWLTRFDCVSLVESCLAVARVAARGGPPTWDTFGREVERMRYRGGVRAGYTSRLHYFSEWITDNARRGLVRELGRELGGEADRRPLRFMTEHRGSYPALRDDRVFAEIGARERALDDDPRRVVPTARIPEVSDRIRTGDILAFATSIEGLDVTHTGLAYRDRRGVLRVLHAPLSGGVVEVSRGTLPEYVAAIRRSTGILVARPLRV